MACVSACMFQELSGKCGLASPRRTLVWQKDEETNLFGLALSLPLFYPSCRSLQIITDPKETCVVESEEARDL